MLDCQTGLEYVGAVLLMDIPSPRSRTPVILVLFPSHLVKLVVPTPRSYYWSFSLPPSLHPYMTSSTNLSSPIRGCTSSPNHMIIPGFLQQHLKWPLFTLVCPGKNFPHRGQKDCFFKLICSWHTMLCELTVYNVLMWHTYIPQYGDHFWVYTKELKTEY